MLIAGMLITGRHKIWVTPELIYARRADLWYDELRLSPTPTCIATNLFTNCFYRYNWDDSEIDLYQPEYGKLCYKNCIPMPLDRRVYAYYEYADAYMSIGYADNGAARKMGYPKLMNVLYSYHAELHSTAANVDVH